MARVSVRQCRSALLSGPVGESPTKFIAVRLAHLWGRRMPSLGVAEHLVQYSHRRAARPCLMAEIWRRDTGGTVMAHRGI